MKWAKPESESEEDEEDGELDDEAAKNKISAVALKLQVSGKFYEIY